jgi:hypothetical protein
LLPAKPDSGNCLAFYCLLFKSNKNRRRVLPFSAAIALCPLEAPGRSSCREKNTPTPHLLNPEICAFCGKIISNPASAK